MTAEAEAFAYMRRIFKAAIPEISTDADLVFVRENPFINSFTGEPIFLQRYEVENVPWTLIGSRFEFTIAHITPEPTDGRPHVDSVLVLEFPIPDMPGGWASVTQYIDVSPTSRYIGPLPPSLSS